MVKEEREVEEKGEGITDGLGPPPPSPRSPLPPSKRILSSPLHCKKKTRDLPNFSNCHLCGLRCPSKGTRDRLQFLPSQWRIVLLCKNCLAAVASADACSYCLAKIPGGNEGDLFDCRKCRRRVHRGCIPQHHRYITPSLFNRDSFACIDCCPIVKPRGSTVSRVSLEDVARDACSAAEKKAVAAARAKENALRKAAAARRATQQARNALDSFLAVKVKEPLANVGEAVPDEELALQLHLAMNGSQRILRNLDSRNSDCSVDLKRVRGSGDSVGRDAESDGHGVCMKVEVCTEDKSFHEDMERTGFAQDSPLDVAVKEEQGSCRDDAGIDSAAVSGRRPGDCTMPLERCTGGVGQDSYGSQQMGRHGAPDRYLKKYSKRNWRSKGMVDAKECQIVLCQQTSCSKVSKSWSDDPHQPPRIPLHPSTSASGLSGC